MQKTGIIPRFFCRNQLFSVFESLTRKETRNICQKEQKKLLSQWLYAAGFQNLSGFPALLLMCSPRDLS